MATSTLDAPASTNRRAEGGARSVFGLALAGVGALLFVVALMAQFYAAPKLSIVPLDQDSVTRLEAPGATVFDTATLKPITTDLSITAHTVGDVKASKAAGGDVRVWTNNTTIKSSDGVIRSQSTKRQSFDGVTGAAVACSSCGNFNEATKDEKVAVKRTGLIYKFPFDTAKKTYQFWDDTAGKAVATRYTGSTTVQGLDVYTFENDVPAMVVGTQDVPKSVFGLVGNENVAADSYYQNHTKYYIEPVTGAIVNQVSDTKNWFEYDGNQLITTQAHISYTPKQVTDMINVTLGNQPSMLSTVKGWVPWAVVVLALMMIAVGGALVRTRSQD
ncbi:MAG: DUF3068 domain-containing protein [Marmoricola sp.]